VYNIHLSKTLVTTDSIDWAFEINSLFPFWHLKSKWYLTNPRKTLCQCWKSFAWEYWDI